MTLKCTPNKKVTDLLFSIITDNCRFWKNLPERNISLDDFLLKKIPENNHATRETDNFIFPFSDKLIEAAQILGAKSNTNFMAYHPKSMMGWHTNSNLPGKRIYYTFSIKPAIFRYKDPKTGIIINDYDDIGWTCREFLIDKENPLWHCIWTEGIRFSFGFNKEI